MLRRTDTTLKFIRIFQLDCHLICCLFLNRVVVPTGAPRNITVTSYPTSLDIKWAVSGLFSCHFSVNGRQNARLDFSSRKKTSNIKTESEAGCLLQV